MRDSPGGGRLIAHLPFASSQERDLFDSYYAPSEKFKARIQAWQKSQRIRLLAVSIPFVISRTD